MQNALPPTSEIYRQSCCRVLPQPDPPNPIDSDSHGYADVGPQLAELAGGSNVDLYLRCLRISNCAYDNPNHQREFGHKIRDRDSHPGMELYFLPGRLRSGKCVSKVLSASVLSRTIRGNFSLRIRHEIQRGE